MIHKYIEAVETHLEADNLFLFAILVSMMVRVGRDAMIIVRGHGRMVCLDLNQYLYAFSQLSADAIVIFS